MKSSTEILEFDLLVIGDGALGMATAIEHARRNPGARTALLAPRGREGAASTAAGLMLNAFGELEPGQLQTPGGQARFQLARRALKAWPQWLENLGECTSSAPPTISQGTVLLCRNEDPAFAVIMEALAEEHEPHTRISPADIPGYNPARAHIADSAIYLPREGSIRATEVIALMDLAAAHHSITRIDGRARSIRHGAHVQAVMLQDGRTFHASSVVVAAGAWSSGIIDSIPELSQRCPRVLFGSGRAYHVRYARDDATARPRTVLRLPNHPSGGSYHLVPFNEQSAFVGASNHLGRSPDSEGQHPAFALDDVASHLRMELAHAHARPVLGHRPISSDGMPLLGRTGLDGVFLATGTRRDGFTTAPVVAHDLVSELLDGVSRFDPAFKPDRCGTPDLAAMS